MHLHQGIVGALSGACFALIAAFYSSSKYLVQVFDSNLHYFPIWSMTGQASFRSTIFYFVALWTDFSIDKFIGMRPECCFIWIHVTV